MPRYNRTLRNIYPVLILVLVTGLLTGCPGIGVRSPLTYNGLYFDTVISITIYEYPGSSSESILAECERICSHYDLLLSPDNSGSDIYRINHADTYPVKVDPDTAEAIRLGIHYGELSDGMVDITAGRLIELWDINGQTGTDDPHIPSEEEIHEALSTVDYRGVSVLEDEAGQCYVNLDNPDSGLELGCIGKGIIADKLDKALRDLGVTSAIINLGGNVTDIGHKPGGAPFRVGIQYPFKAPGETIAMTDAYDTSVVSSGVYERYFTLDGKNYHHIFDLRTGYPADSGVLGVTVRCASSADADALSTLFLILGTDESIRLAETMPDTEIMLIDEGYNIITSSGWIGEVP